MRLMVTYRWSIPAIEDYPEITEYGQYTHTATGVFDPDAYDAMIQEIADYHSIPTNRIIVLNTLKLEEPPADVRMSAESLIELQRIAAARAVLAFAERFSIEMEYPHVLATARMFADDVQSGRISW